MDNFIEYLIVAVILLWSCYVVLRRFMPQSSFKMQQHFASWLSGLGLIRLGGWLSPKAVAVSGCSAGCSDCGVVNQKNKSGDKTSNTNSSCATMNANQVNQQIDDVQEQPVQWRL